MKITKQIKLLALAALSVTSVLSAQAQTNAVAEAVAEKKPEWASTAAAGLTLTSGNSETLLVTVSAGTVRKSENNEFSLGGDFTYGESKDQTTDEMDKNAHSYRLFIQYNRLFSERLYGYARADDLYDAIANVKYRVSLSPGLGYYFIKEKAADLCVEAGPGYVFDNLLRTSGVGTNAVTKYTAGDYPTLRIGEKFHYKLSDRARLWQTADRLPQVEHFEKYIINFEIGVEADLTQSKNFTLRVFFQDTYNSDPAADSDGSALEKNDSKIVAALGYKF